VPSQLAFLCGPFYFLMFSCPLYSCTAIYLYTLMALSGVLNTATRTSSPDLGILPPLKSCAPISCKTWNACWCSALPSGGRLMTSITFSGTPPGLVIALQMKIYCSAAKNTHGRWCIFHAHQTEVICL